SYLATVRVTALYAAGANARHIRSRSGTCQANPNEPARCHQAFGKSAAIWAGSWGRRRGCRAAGSPSWGRFPASVRASRDRRPRADTARRRIAPVYRPTAPVPGQPWHLSARYCLAAWSGSARNRWRDRAMMERSAPAASPAPAEPAPRPRPIPRSARMTGRAWVLSSCGENGLRVRMFRRGGGFNLAKAGSASGRTGPQASGLAIPDQREMPHRRHRTPLGQADAAMAGRPVDQPRPRKFRPPAEPPRQWRERQFEQPARAAFGADVIDQDQLAAGLQHANKIIERALGIGHRGDDILRHH